MNCPCCRHGMTSVKVKRVTVDVCASGCGGVWFDEGELERFDDQEEYAPSLMTRPVSNASVVVNKSAERRCPRCLGRALGREVYNHDFAVEFDHCASCDGTFLDLGELSQLRQDRADAEMRQQIIDESIEKYAAGDSQKTSRLKGIFHLLFAANR